MRVLFVDFDGVLHAADTKAFVPSGVSMREVRDINPLTFVHAQVLAACLTQHRDVRVVVHSTWRNLFSDEELLELLPELAPWMAGSVGARYVGREQAIRAYVEAGRVQTFRIIDDEPAVFSMYAEHVIACDPRRGLDDPEVLGRLRHWLESSAG